MTVKNTSWHYRLWKLGRSPSSEPHNLCKYFWHLTLFKVVGPAIIALLALAGIGALVWVVVKNPLVSLLTVALTALGVAFIFGLVVAIQKLNERGKRKRKIRRLGPPAPPKEPNIVWEYVKARKKKYCPLITVVEESHSSGA